MKTPKFKNVKYPVTLDELLETEEGKLWKQRLVQRELQSAMGTFRVGLAFCSPNLRILCNFIFKNVDEKQGMIGGKQV